MECCCSRTVGGEMSTWIVVDGLKCAVVGAEMGFGFGIYFQIQIQSPFNLRRWPLKGHIGAEKGL